MFVLLRNCFYLHLFLKKKKLDKKPGYTIAESELNRYTTNSSMLYVFCTRYKRANIHYRRLEVFAMHYTIYNYTIKNKLYNYLHIIIL